MLTAPRGTVVAAPLGNREMLGVVWGPAEGTVGDNRLKIAEPLGSTVYRMLVGYAAGSALGVAFGLLLGSNRIADWMIRPLLAR